MAHSPRGGGQAAAAVSARLDALQTLTYPDLRAEWRRLYRSDPPKRASRDLLLLGVAWKIQAQAYGGLKPATKRQLESLAESSARAGSEREFGPRRRDRLPPLKPGTKLIREWRGETHTVVVLEDGFQWQGSAWRSLSSIARAISGSHRSGPRFFGLHDRKSLRPANVQTEREGSDA